MERPRAILLPSMVDAATKPLLPDAKRGALGRIDRNTKRPAIPRPSPHPDVFTVSENAKRRVEPHAPKRPRFEEVVDKARKKPIDEKWISKWLKMFPTLRIHFEAGAEDATLRQRVIKLGATVDPFFSHTVTHLIKSTDSLAVKAADMGIKVWSLKKLGELVSNISPVEVISDSLHTLLEDERLHGTRERDLLAPRPDHYYFKPGNKYTLVEDATGRHRPIMIKEYASAEWPVLYETFLRTPSVDTPIDKLRARAWSLYVDRQPFEDEQPLRRSISMRDISTPELPQASPYQIASGNSVIITSNIASTSNANPPIPLARKPVLQLSKRVQVLRGNLKRPQPNDLFAPQRRASTGALERKTFVSQDQLVNMLRRARQPVQEDDVTREMRIVNHERVYGMGNEEAPGYCENCRIRYTDLSIHVASKKHRRFAHDDQHFAQLDNLLVSLRRPTLEGDVSD